MKALALVTLALVLITQSAQAASRTIESADTEINVGRVVELKNLVSKDGLQVNIVVQDLGGSTDVSPTQNVYLTLYSKGEMFSTDASFLIDTVFAFKGAKRLEGGLYEVSYLSGELKDAKLVIDARKAIKELQAVRCEDFDCDASTNFKSSVRVAPRK